MNDLQQFFDDLKKPFHPSQVQWKPGAIKGDRAIALAYADLRVYMNRLDEVCGSDWSVSYEPWGDTRIICRLTIMGVMRSSTGEMAAQDEKNEIGGTVAEAQALKRACATFGLGRYLYNLPTGWADYDPAKKQFTDKAKARLTGILVQHYRRATEGGKSELADMFNGNGDGESTEEPQASKALTPLEQFDELGKDLYGDQWPKVCQRNVERISNGKAQNSGELTPDQVQQLIAGMNKLIKNRKPIQTHRNGTAT